MFSKLCTLVLLNSLYKSSSGQCFRSAIFFATVSTNLARVDFSISGHVIQKIRLNVKIWNSFYSLYLWSYVLKNLCIIFSRDSEIRSKIKIFVALIHGPMFSKCCILFHLVVPIIARWLIFLINQKISCVESGESSGFR